MSSILNNNFSGHRKRFYDEELPSATFWGFFCSVSFVNELTLFQDFAITLRKVSKYGVFLVRISPHLDWIWRHLRSKFLYSVWIRENTDQKKLRIWTLFTQWLLIKRYKIELGNQLLYFLLFYIIFYNFLEPDPTFSEKRFLIQIFIF